MPLRLALDARVSAAASNCADRMVAWWRQAHAAQGLGCALGLSASQVQPWMSKP